MKNNDAPLTPYEEALQALDRIEAELDAELAQLDRKKEETA